MCHAQRSSIFSISKCREQPTNDSHFSESVAMSLQISIGKAWMRDGGHWLRCQYNLADNFTIISLFAYPLGSAWGAVLLQSYRTLLKGGNSNAPCSCLLSPPRVRLWSAQWRCTGHATYRNESSSLSLYSPNEILVAQSGEECVRRTLLCQVCPYSHARVSEAYLKAKPGTLKQWTRRPKVMLLSALLPLCKVSLMCSCICCTGTSQSKATRLCVCSA